MTLKQIAKECNVSISTVSRVLNSSIENAASKELTDKIKKIADDAGYKSNKHALELKFGAKAPRKTIYCLIACSAQKVSGNPFFTTAMSAVEKEAKIQNCLVDYTFYRDNPEGGEISNLINNKDAKLLLIIGKFKQDLYEKLVVGFEHIIYMAWNDLKLPLDCVLCDGYAAGKDAAEYLHDLGHRKFAYIGSEDDRFKGFLTGIKELKADIKKENVLINPDIFFGDKEVNFNSLINKNLDFTALFCSSDTLAIAALADCKALNIKVPEDISILSMNNTQIAQYASPTISSIHIPLEEMGRMATILLLDRAENNRQLPIKSYFPYKIVKRESCAKAK